MLRALILSVHGYLCHSEESWGDRDSFKHSMGQKLSSKSSMKLELELLYKKGCLVSFPLNDRISYSVVACQAVLYSRKYQGWDWTEAAELF